MNRREFMRAALAGLVALVLPKGKQEAPVPTVTYGDVDKLWRRDHGGMPIVDGSLHVRFDSSDERWRWTTSPEIEVRGPEQETLFGFPIHWVDNAGPMGDIVLDIIA